MFRPGRLHDGLGRGDRRGVDDSLRSGSVLDGASTALHSLTRDNITVFSCRLTPSPKLLIIGGESSHALGIARARSCSCIAASASPPGSPRKCQARVASAAAAG